MAEVNSSDSAEALQAPDADTFDTVVPLDEQAVAEKLEKLGAMGRIKYAQEREELAAELGVPLGFLDAEWKERHTAPKNGGSSKPANDIELLACPDRVVRLGC